jgi:uncharacterized protein
MFVDREEELEFLNSLLKRERPTRAQMILLYGRRRVGKTVLARHWADATGLPTIYWFAETETAPLQRRKLYAKMLGVTMDQAPVFGAWADLWTAFARQIGDKPYILIVDEVTRAAEADSAFLSSLQNAWDELFKHTRLIIILSGSQVHAMETLLHEGSPLFGRFTGQWHLQPLAFSALRQFFPSWSADERVAAYGILGGIPAYLETLDPAMSLSDNLQKVILNKGSMFLGEPEVLLADKLREPRTYVSILKAIGLGKHTVEAIGEAAQVPRLHLTAYLSRLMELRLIERRLSALTHPEKQRTSRLSHYHLADPFLLFYYRFVAPEREEIGYRPEQIVPDLVNQLRAFLGATAFEALCRDWVVQVSQNRALPFQAQQVGSHWSRGVNIDVVALNWKAKAVLLGECKWGKGAIERDVVRDLTERKIPLALKALPEEGKGWTVHPAFFARDGLTPAAQAYAKELKPNPMLVVSLKMIDHDLGGAPAKSRG